MKDKGIENLYDLIGKYRSIAIGGHVDPDGDCIGVCCGLFYYVRKYFPDTDVRLYLEEQRDVFKYINALSEASSEYDGFIPEAVVVLDVSSPDRIGVIRKLFESTEETICIDHHISNHGIAKVNHVIPDASSASEVLYDLMGKEKIDRDIAIALYTGIVHDSGVFQYSNTSPGTMEAGAFLISKGFDFTKIIEETFYQRTHREALALGKVLSNSKLLCNGLLIIGSLDHETIEEYGLVRKELGAIVSHLRLTRGTEVALFAYSLDGKSTKISLRSNDKMDVSKISMALGGGGHDRAAGCNLDVPLKDAMDKVIPLLEKELVRLYGERAN